MVEPETTEFWRAALRSGLVDAGGLRACWEAVPEPKRTPDAIDRRMARRAVEAGLLTVWQAQQLLSGRSTGYQIDKYQLLDILGVGGMGRVYLARDTRLGRKVALKLLPAARLKSPRAVTRFRREARIGAQMEHENLVRVYDAGESGPHYYLVMEFVDGTSVGRLLAEHGPMPVPTAARLAYQVSLGLEHARIKGLIHRDVSPWNILVTSAGVAKLSDMGLALELGDSEALTTDGATVGTFDYLAPEQAKHSRDADTRSDIYSLGCTVYHMLTGQVPFPAVILAEKIYAHIALDPAPPSTLAPAVPEALDAVVLKMMRKAPEARYATPLEVAEALEPFLGALPASIRSGPIPADRLAADARGGAAGAAYPVQVMTPPGGEALGFPRSSSGSQSGGDPKAPRPSGSGSRPGSSPGLAGGASPGDSEFDDVRLEKVPPAWISALWPGGPGRLAAIVLLAAAGVGSLIAIALAWARRP